MTAASRWGAQYLQITATEGSDDPFVLKCGFLSGLADTLPTVEQVLWIDGDALVREDCDNIFDLVPVDNFGGVANFQGDTHNGVVPENQTRLPPGRITDIVDMLQLALQEDPEGAPVGTQAALDERVIKLLYALEQNYDPVTFINGGMFVFSPKHHAGVFDRLKGATDHMDEIDPADEQAILNAAIILDGTPRTMLNRTYNRVGKTAWKCGPMTDKVQHLAHFRWGGTDSRFWTPGLQGDKTDMLELVDWRVPA